MELVIRNAAKILIISNGCLLVTKKIKQNETYCVLPGGGQIGNETLEETVKRECLEELGISEIEVGNIAFIREGFGYLDIENWENEIHRMDFVFECKISDCEIGGGNLLDSGHIENCWINVDELDDLGFRPKGLISYIQDFSHGKRIENKYLGNLL